MNEPVSPAAAPQQQAPAAVPEPAPARTRWYEYLFGLVIFGAFCFWVLTWGFEGAVHNRPVQIVPDLKGKSLAAAVDLLAPLNLAMRKEGTEFNKDIPIGTILRQMPPAGAKVREGKTVRVVISQGGETVFVPSLSGLPMRNAEMLLRQNQLTLGEVTESYSIRMDKGMVLSQNPKAEQSVERNAMVNVVVSGGPPPAGVVLMPDFLRKNISEATAWANSAGVEVATTKDSASLFPYGVIIEQEPSSDSVLPPGSKIKLVISGRPKSEAGEPSMKKLHYKVPQGSSDNHVRVVMLDQYGERELFNGLRSPGSKIDIDVPPSEGQSRIKIFLNAVLVEERDW